MYKHFRAVLLIKLIFHDSAETLEFVTTSLLPISHAIFKEEVGCVNNSSSPNSVFCSDPYFALFQAVTFKKQLSQAILFPLHFDLSYEGQMSTHLVENFYESAKSQKVNCKENCSIRQNCTWQQPTTYLSFYFFLIY